MLDASIPLTNTVPPPQDPMAQYGRVVALQGQMQGQQLQSAQLTGVNQENQMRQTQMDQMHTLNAAYNGALNPDGTVDTQKLTSALAANGAGSRIPDVLKGVTEYQQTLQNLQKTKLEVGNLESDTLGSFGNTLQKAGYDPQLFLTKAQMAINSKALDPSQVQALAPQIQQVQQSLLQDPSGASARNVVKGIADSAVAQSEKWQTIQAQQQTAQGAADRGAAATGELQLRQTQQAKEDAATKLGQAPNAPAYTSAWNMLRPDIRAKFPDPSSYDPASTPNVALRVGMSPDQIAQADNRAAQLAKVTTPAELALQAAKGNKDAMAALDLIKQQSIAERQASNPNVSVNLTPAGQAVYDKELQTTGQPIAIPRGPGGAQVINSLNRLGAATPDVNLGATKANFGADKGSLANMQKQSDALDAYGAKFIGNLNQFKQIITQLPDSGSPYLNTPIRELDQKALGSAVYGRLNVARTIAANEGGRILAGGGNLGGVVSDNARHEIGTLLDPGATVGQWMTAADQLNTDYGITKKAMADQLTTIKGRIASGNSSSQTQAAAPSFKVGDSVMYGGKTHKVVGITPDGKLQLDGTN